MKYRKGTGIKSIKCGLCGKEMHDIEYPRHLALIHRDEIERHIITEGQEQFDKEVEEEANEPRIGPLDPADIFWQ